MCELGYRKDLTILQRKKKPWKISKEIEIMW